MRYIKGGPRDQSEHATDGFGFSVQGLSVEFREFLKFFKLLDPKPVTLILNVNLHTIAQKTSENLDPIYLHVCMYVLRTYVRVRIRPSRLCTKLVWIVWGGGFKMLLDLCPKP